VIEYEACRNKPCTALRVVVVLRRVGMA